jgi:GNAT superfamily N-acetyltransferase
MQRLEQRIGMGDDLAEAFRTRLLPEPKYTPDMAFTAFDEYFSPGTTLEFTEVSLKDKDSVTDLGAFYTRIYMECFPDVNERETFDSLLSYLKAAESAKNYHYHILLAKNSEGEVVGGAIFDYFRATNAGVIEFIAIQKDQQSGGVGTAVYRQVLRVLYKDAYRNKKKLLSNVFCEIDSPEYNQASIKKYLYFWSKHHFKRLDFSYIQPSLSPTQEAVTGLWFTVASQNGAPPTVSGSYVLQVIHDYMKYAMRIEDPKAHPDYQRMEAELQAQKQVALRSIL